MNESLFQPTVSSKVIYEGRVVKLRVDTVQLPSGRVTTREIVEHDASVCVVPVDAQGNVLLVRQYRTPTKKLLLEVPAGGMEPGEDPDETVLRELQEETGYTAGKLQKLGGFWLAPGWCDEFMHAYLAAELRPAQLDGDEDENIAVETVPWCEISTLIESGEIQDAKSIAALLLAQSALAVSK